MLSELKETLDNLKRNMEALSPEERSRLYGKVLKLESIMRNQGSKQVAPPRVQGDGDYLEES